MFAYIKGLLSSCHPSSVVVEVGGIGYALLVPLRSLQELPPVGQMVHLYTTLVVREASHTLYGFLAHAERDIFEALLQVSGIGPRLALSLIGHLTFEELQHAIAQQELSALCRVPGVGKKTAERLIVELKDRLPHLLTSLLGGGETSSPQMNREMQDAILALIHLGYSQTVSQRAVAQSSKELGVQASLPLLITHALKHAR